MEQKFYLNKFLKVDNIENYTLSSLRELENVYDKFKEKSEGSDPDFPEIVFDVKKKKLDQKANSYNQNKDGSLNELLNNDTQSELSIISPQEARRQTKYDRENQLNM